MKKKYFGLNMPLLIAVSLIVIFATKMGILSTEF
ncbi:hypothetical protein ABID14_001480 [Peptoniphilus olsenii]|uniref:Uncharacterized protein n=1 Tax=Peptoniphilus olsenii TaxID=411570 RepID=A0ABV2JAK6_9FIRM